MQTEKQKEALLEAGKFLLKSKQENYLNQIKHAINQIHIFTMDSGTVKKKLNVLICSFREYKRNSENYKRIFGLEFKDTNKQFEEYTKVYHSVIEMDLLKENEKYKEIIKEIDRTLSKGDLEKIADQQIPN
jgi:hypothetical protein